MGKFNDWFHKNLKISSYPTSETMELYKNYSIVINVSDEYKIDIHSICTNKYIKYFWFPMSECGDNMGLNSIFGALQILWLSEKENLKVLVFCHAGSNRSVTIAECYYYLRTKQYPKRKPKDKKLEQAIESMFVFENEIDLIKYREISNNSRLQNNIESGHLPAKHKMHEFLKECEKAFQKGNDNFLDTIKIKTNNQSY